jgi:hypothetical protein
MVILIELVAKSGIVQFVKEKGEHGAPLVEAATEGEVSQCSVALGGPMTLGFRRKRKIVVATVSTA